MDDSVFTTFFHINDYEEAGYRALPLYMSVSYPAVLWGPSGQLLEQYYRDNVCAISPQQFLGLVKAGHVHIIARAWWYTDRQRREAMRWSGAHWLDGFDDVIERLYRDGHPAVHSAPEPDGFEWAAQYLEQRPEVERKVLRLIQQGRVPAGVSQKAFEDFEQGRHRDAVLWALRDLRNHVQAKRDAEAHVPFLSAHDGDFFRLMEGPDAQLLAEHRTHWGQAVLEAIDGMVDRLNRPERVGDIPGFMTSEAHRELATWFRLATDVSNTVIPRDYGELIAEKLWEHVARGRLSETTAQMLYPRDSQSGVPADKLIARLADAAFDATGRVDIGNLDVGVVGIRDGISIDVGMLRPDHVGPQWSHLTSF